MRTGGASAAAGATKKPRSINLPSFAGADSKKPSSAAGTKGGGGKDSGIKKPKKKRTLQKYKRRH